MAHLRTVPASPRGSPESLGMSPGKVINMDVGDGLKMSKLYKYIYIYNIIYMIYIYIYYCLNIVKRFEISDLQQVGYELVAIACSLQGTLSASHRSQCVQS